MIFRAAAFGVFAAGGLISVMGLAGSPVDADTAAVVAPVVAAPVGDRVQPDPGLVSSVISESSRNISDGAVAVADTGWQVAEGVYYLGGELIESGRIIGVSTMQILGLLSSDGVQDRQRLGEQGVAGVWWGTSAAKTAETTAVSAPTMPVSPTAPLPVVAGPRHTVGGDRALAARQSRPNAAITPASLSASDGKEAGPETPALAADQGTVADDTCSWDFRRDRKPVTLSGEDVAVLSKLGLMDESAQRLPDGTIFLPKVTQRLLEVRTAFTCKGTVSTTRRLVGHVIANPTSSGLVQAEQDGRIEGGEFGFPVIGQRVEKGQLLGYLLPILSSKERAELQGEIALVRGKIAEQELAIARTRELPLLPFRDGRILSMRIELSKLRAQRDALIDGLSARQPLTASASGVVARSEVRVGQVVEERQLLWEIADTSDLWIEADSFGSQTNFATTGSTAETQDGQTMHLTLKGLGLSTDGAQSSPVQFRVDGIPDGVRIGQQVVVNVRELAQIEGVMAPRSALVRRSNGEMTVWVAKGPEQYEPRKVKWTPAGSHVAIIEAGVTEGVRVVVSGATLLSEVR